MSDLGAGEIQSLLELAVKLKAGSKSGNKPSLTDKVVGLLFEKPSTRTARVSKPLSTNLVGRRYT